MTLDYILDTIEGCFDLLLKITFVIVGVGVCLYIWCAILVLLAWAFGLEVELGNTWPAVVT